MRIYVCMHNVGHAGRMMNRCKGWLQKGALIATPPPATPSPATLVPREDFKCPAIHSASTKTNWPNGAHRLPSVADSAATKSTPIKVVLVANEWVQQFPLLGYD